MLSVIFILKNYNYSLIKCRSNRYQKNIQQQTQPIKVAQQTMKKIIRYSLYGFKPQYQSYHLEHINYDMYNFDIKDFPEHLQYVVQERHDKLLPFYQEYYEDFKEGIWFFLEGYKSNFSLNHLKRKVPCWKAEIEDDAIVYEPNWAKIVALDDPLVEFGGCYLPKREMYKIHNIQKVTSGGYILHY